MNLHTFLKEVDTLHKECREILVKKNNDYSNTENIFSNFEERNLITGIETEKLFLNDIAMKVSRIKNLTWKKALNEPLEDSVKDLINYATLLYCYLKQNTIIQEDSVLTESDSVVEKTASKVDDSKKYEVTYTKFF